MPISIFCAAAQPGSFTIPFQKPLIFSQQVSKVTPMDEPSVQRPRGKRIQLMSTCLCDTFYAEAAIATVEVLEHLGCEVEFPEAQTCCGQPAFNAGDWDSARKVVRYTRGVFSGEDPVVLPSGSCKSMLDHGAQIAFEGEADAGEQGRWSRRTWEVCDYIVNGLGIRQWPGRYPARVSLHRSCHTRGSNSYESAVQLLSSIEGLELAEVGELEQCCGFGGTFSVSFPNISTRMGDLKVSHLMAPKPDVIASLDMACMLHFGGMMDRQQVRIPRLHVAQILRDALRNEEAGS
jgi:L-lactate dehydrogenase complex protein LldE